MLWQKAHGGALTLKPTGKMGDHMDLGTYADGRAISYDQQSGIVDVGGTPVTPQQLREYDDAGQVTWAAEGHRAWLDTSFPPVAATTPSKVRKIPALVVVVGALLLCGMCVFVANLMPDATTPSPAPAAQEAAPAPAAEVPVVETPAEPVVETPTEPVVEAPAEPVVEAPSEPALSMGQQQAVDKGQAYLDMGGFSRKSLIGQLVYEGFTKSEATFAVDYIDPNWNTQATQKAKAYLEMGGFSRAGLIDQLLYEGFTKAQAKHGVKDAGY